MESLEVSGKSVDEAIETALQQLEAKLSEVEVTILSKGRGGILGVGAEDARIRVTRVDIGRSRMSTPNFPPRPPAISYASESSPGGTEDEDLDEPEPVQRAPRPSSPPPSRGRSGPAPSRGPSASSPARGPSGPPPSRAPAPPPPPRSTPAAPFVSSGGAPSTAGQEALQKLLEQMGFEVEVVETEPPAPSATSDGTVVAFDVRGDDLGVLIGRRGQTLSSLQYLINLMVNRQLNDPAMVVVDVEGYRARRYESLRGLAQRMADRVRNTGQSVTLEPMNAAERRIIHMALQDYRDVGTQSVGEGDSRKVSIVPRRR